MHRLPVDRKYIEKVVTRFVPDDDPSFPYKLEPVDVILKDQLLNWLRGNTQHPYKVELAMNPTHIIFESEGDAVTYKMAFI